MGRRLDHLANVSPADFASFASRVPQRVKGREFLDRYGGTGDHATAIDPDRVYPVRVATAHPIYEHSRVRGFAHELSSDHDDRAPHLGALMYESHSSYSACGLGSDGTDALVAFVRHAGPESGIYGAKITGGGSGGAVAILGRSDAASAVHTIAARYARRTGRRARVFEGSSSGAAACGVCELR